MMSMSNYALEFAEGGWVFALAAALLLAFAWHVRKSPAGRSLLLLRGAAVMALVLALLKTTFVSKDALKVKPKLLILVDVGHSMRSERLDSALKWLKTNSAAIEERVEPVYYAVSDRARALSGARDLQGLKGSDAGFYPADSLRDVLDSSGADAARAWLLSDGNAETQAQPSDDLNRVLARLGMPLDTLGIGPARRSKGISFVEIKTPDFVFLHGRFSVSMAAEATALAGDDLRLRLYKEPELNDKKEWTLIEEKRAAVRSDFETFTATFTGTAQRLGLERYRLEISQGGLTVSREFRVEVIRQKYRIMYLSGRPSAEYSNLREFLKSDPNHELVSFVILRNPDSAAMVPNNELSLIPFPADEIFVQSLSQFDLFILENFSYRRFNLPVSYLSALKGFVASGGALLIIGGENAFGLGGYRGTPLEEILPVTMSDAVPDFLPGLFNAKVTALDHPLMRLYDTPQESKAAWEALPPMDGYARFGSVRPQATVLAVHPREKTSSGEPLPVLAFRDYGRGKVMMVSSDSTWRWRLGAAQNWKIANFYGRFWTKTVQYLTGSLDLSKVKFAPLPDHIPAREPALFDLRVFDENFHPAPGTLAELSVIWTKPDGKAQEVTPQEKEPGVFVLQLTGLAAGTHRLKATARLRGKPWGEDQIRFLWEPYGTEAPMDRRWLKITAEATGGTASDLAAASAEELLAKLPAVRMEAQVRRRYYPWASPFWLELTAALLLLEWALRRWRGHA